jgi:hypothetical protein
MSSGGHFNPAVTIAFAVWKGNLHHPCSITYLMSDTQVSLGGKSRDILHVKFRGLSSLPYLCTVNIDHTSKSVLCRASALSCCMCKLARSHDFQDMEAKLIAAGKEADIFSPAGPAGIFAVYQNAGVHIGWTFMNEFFVVCCNSPGYGFLMVMHWRLL